METKINNDIEIFKKDFEKNINDYCMNIYQLLESNDDKIYTCILFIRYHNEKATSLEINDLYYNQKLVKRIVHSPYFKNQNDSVNNDNRISIIKEILEMRKEFYEKFYKEEPDNKNQFKNKWTKNVNKINQVYNKFVRDKNMLDFIHSFLEDH